MSQQLDDLIKVEEHVSDFLNKFFNYLLELFKKRELSDVERFEKLRKNIQHVYKKEGANDYIMNTIIQKDPSRAFLIATTTLMVQDPKLEDLMKQDPNVWKEYEKVRDQFPKTTHVYPQAEEQDVVSLDLQKAKEVETQDNKEIQDNKEAVDSEKEMTKEEAFAILVKGETQDPNVIESCENVISKDADLSYKYSTEVLKAPFEKGEQAMAKDTALFLDYVGFVKEYEDKGKDKELHTSVKL